MKRALFVCLAIAAAIAPRRAAAQSAQAWAGLHKAIAGWEALSFDKKFAVNAGLVTGNVFTYQSADFDPNTYRMPGASLSKWPSAVMISGMVQDGILSYDDKANKYLKYWATDEQDHRSGVTLRQLLSFTSGLQTDSYLPCFRGFDACAQEMYEHLGPKEWKRPNTTWTYLSGHLQFAGAMATAAAGAEIQSLMKKYLFDAYNMTSTTYGPTNNPSMAAGITTTGQDFENLLQRLLAASVLHESVLAQMETDWSKAPVSPSGDGWFGHYGMGHWWECLGYGTPSERAPLPPICTEAHIQAGPGEFGFYPLVDRSEGGGAAGPKRPKYYMQVAIQEPDALSGIPEYLRILTKPVVDLILAGQDPTAVARKTILKNGGGLLLRDVEFIKGELGECTCENAPGKNEPYATLEANLPADKPKLNREELLEAGEALTIYEVAAIQAKVGACTCASRQ